MSKVRKVVVLLTSLVVSAGVGVYAAFQLSPWPMVWLVRHAFDQGAQDAAASISGLVPQGISAQRRLSYAPDDGDAWFDVFAPSAQSALPAIVWVHGGGFIAGTRSDLSGYLQVLAARGYVTVAIDYSTAPEARFPTPVRQTNLALSYLVANAQRFKLDPERIFSGRRFSRRADRRAVGLDDLRFELR
ncbi:MAG: alpha/beta hydrolase [Pseudomonadota bacterium]